MLHNLSNMSHQPLLNTNVPVLANAIIHSDDPISNEPVMARIAPINDNTAVVAHAHVSSHPQTKSASSRSAVQATVSQQTFDHPQDELDALHDLRKFLDIIESPLLHHCNVCDEAVVSTDANKVYDQNLWKKLVKSVIIAKEHEDESNFLKMNHMSPSARNLVIRALHWRPQ